MTKIYRYIYISISGVGWGGLHGPPYIFVIIHGNEKKHKHNLHLNQILHFDFKKIPRLNNKQFTKIGSQGSPISLLSEYSCSNCFHSNTPNSRHLFNTNG